jgi:MscS family membrane protein
VVTIPNGDFSSQRIENFALRDRYLFQVIVKIDYTLSPDRVRQAVALVEQVLVGHARVLDDPRRATLKEFAPDSLAIEAFAYIDTFDYPESLVIRQELLLTILDRFKDAGIEVIAPLRPLYLSNEAQDTPVEEATKEK